MIHDFYVCVTTIKLNEENVSLFNFFFYKTDVHVSCKGCNGDRISQQKLKCIPANCPYFDHMQQKAKKERFFHATLFLQKKSVHSNV